jgi:propionyl-CoA synthetase
VRFVQIYMPMIPEAAVAMLACARIGAVHSVVFGGFAPNELAVRIDDAAPKLVIAASCGLEGTKGALPYMPLVNEAIEKARDPVPHVIVKQRTEAAAVGVVYELIAGRDHDFDACVASGAPTPCVPVSANAPLYSIYTSGTTGDPKGIMRDNTHAVMLQWTLNEFFTTGPNETMFVASDIGWVVGPSYIVFGPLIHGATSIMFEGKPVGTPDAGTFWRLIDETKATMLFTAPTALRAIRKEDPNGDFVRQSDISSLRALFVAGERADPGTVEHFEKLLGVPVIDHVSLYGRVPCHLLLHHAVKLR